MNKRKYTPLIVVGALMLATAIVLAVSVDVYDALFWVRFCWSLLFIAVGALGVFAALRVRGDKPALVRAFSALLLYAVAMIQTLALVPNARALFLLAFIQSVLYGLVLFLSGGVSGRAQP